MRFRHLFGATAASFVLAAFITPNTCEMDGYYALSFWIVCLIAWIMGTLAIVMKKERYFNDALVLLGLAPLLPQAVFWVVALILK